MKLAQAIKNVVYRITAIEREAASEIFSKKLFHLGVMEGVEVVLKHKAPIFGNPLLIEIDSLQIAMTKSEANLISIEEKKDS